jgi:hypothetical protein
MLVGGSFAILYKFAFEGGPLYGWTLIGLAATMGLVFWIAVYSSAILTSKAEKKFVELVEFRGRNRLTDSW